MVTHLRTLFATFSLLLALSSLLAQDEPSRIWAIRIAGNRVTQSELIEREMTSKVGMPVESSRLEADRRRLMSLGLFNHVDIAVVADQGRVVLRVTVTERFYIYPLPILAYDPLDPKRRVVGLRLHHDNFRGYGERLSIAYWDGYQNGASILHRDPWFSIKGAFGVQIFGLTNRRELARPDTTGYVDTQTDLVALRLQHRLHQRSWIGFEGQWEERYSKAAFYTLAGSGRDRLMVGRVFFEADGRDHIYYPSSGYYLLAMTESDMMIDTSHVFHLQLIDLRAYRPVGGVILAGRFYAENSLRQLPYYRRLEISPVNIRSKQTENLLGLGLAALNLETRFNLLPLRYINGPNWALVGPYVQNMKFSIEGLLFLDNAVVRRVAPQKELTLRAWGGGLQFQLPYVETARIVAGWNPESRLGDPFLHASLDVTF